MKRKVKMYLLEILILLGILSFSKNAFLGYVWVILHELIHIMVAKFLKIRINRLEVHITGSRILSGNVEHLFENGKLILYLCGPLFNLICGGVFFLISRYYKLELFKACMIINFGLGMFNLLPAYPLDGGRILEIIINKKMFYKRARAIVVKMGFIVSAILMTLFILTIYIHKPNGSLLISSILITYSSLSEKKNTIYLIMSSILKKRQKLMDRKYIENKSFSIYFETTLVSTMQLFDKNKYNIVYVVDENFKVVNIIYEEQIIEAVKIYGNINLKEYIEKSNNT